MQTRSALLTPKTGGVDEYVRSFRPDRVAYTITTAEHLKMLPPRSFLKEAGESVRILFRMVRKT